MKFFWVNWHLLQAERGRLLRRIYRQTSSQVQIPPAPNLWSFSIVGQEVLLSCAARKCLPWWCHASLKRVTCFCLNHFSLIFWPNSAKMTTSKRPDLCSRISNKAFKMAAYWSVNSLGVIHLFYSSMFPHFLFHKFAIDFITLGLGHRT